MIELALVGVTGILLLAFFATFLADGPRQREPWEIERDKRDLWRECGAGPVYMAMRKSYPNLTEAEYYEAFSIRETPDGHCIFTVNASTSPVDSA